MLIDELIETWFNSDDHESKIQSEYQEFWYILHEIQAIEYRKKERCDKCNQYLP